MELGVHSDLRGESDSRKETDDVKPLVDEVTVSEGSTASLCSPSPVCESPGEDRGSESSSPDLPRAAVHVTDIQSEAASPAIDSQTPGLEQGDGRDSSEAGIKEGNSESLENSDAVSGDKDSSSTKALSIETEATSHISNSEETSAAGGDQVCADVSGGVSTGGSEEKGMPDVDEKQVKSDGPVSGTGESGDCIVLQNPAGSSEGKPSDVGPPCEKKQSGKPVKDEPSVIAVEASPPAASSNEVPTTMESKKESSHSAANEALTEDSGDGQTVRRPNVGDSGSLANLGPKTASGAGGLGMADETDGRVPERGQAPPSTEEKRAYFSATMANTDGTLKLPKVLPAEPRELLPARRPTEEDSNSDVEQNKVTENGETVVAATSDANQLMEQTDMNKLAAAPGVNGGPPKLISTIDNPQAIFTEERDLPPFDPAFAEQYMIFSQQYNAYAHQFALYAQYCVHQGAVETAKKQHEEQQKQRAAALAKAQKKAAKKGKPIPQPPESGNAARQIMITPYRHNWILSANSEENPTSWWEHIANEFHRLIGASVCGDRSCGCNLFSS